MDYIEFNKFVLDIDRRLSAIVGQAFDDCNSLNSIFKVTQNSEQIKFKLKLRLTKKQQQQQQKTNIVDHYFGQLVGEEDAEEGLRAEVLAHRRHARGGDGQHEEDLRRAAQAQGGRERDGRAPQHAERGGRPQVVPGVARSHLEADGVLQAPHRASDRQLGADDTRQQEVPGAARAPRRVRRQHLQGVVQPRGHLVQQQPREEPHRPRSQHQVDQDQL